MISEYQLVAPTIAINGSTSSSFGCGEYNAGSVQMPAALTSSTFWAEVSNDNSHFTRLQDATGANIVERPCSANSSLPLPAGVFNYKFARLVLSNAEVAARVLSVFLKS